MGIGIIDAKENEIPNYHGFPVFCGEGAIEDFAQLNWVDEALFSIPTELALPDKMIKNFGIMGITIHIKLARVADDSSNQIVEKLEGYTVLSTSINMVSAGQLIFKRTMDICGGLVGMLLTGIIFVFVAPIIYISHRDRFSSNRCESEKMAKNSTFTNSEACIWMQKSGRKS